MRLVGQGQDRGACHQQHYQEVPSGGPLMALERSRQTERNMEEESGERDEGEQLEMGSPGTTITRQKLPKAHSDQGLMCFETQ